MFNFFKFSLGKKIVFIVLVSLATPIFYKSGVRLYDKEQFDFLSVLGLFFQYLFCTFIMADHFSASLFPDKSENPLKK